MQISFPTLPVKEQNNQKQQNYESKNRVATLALFPQTPFADVNQPTQNHQTRKFTFSFPQNPPNPIMMQGPPPNTTNGPTLIIPPHSMQIGLPPHVPTKQAIQIAMPQQPIIQQPHSNIIITTQPSFPKQVVKKAEPAQRKVKKERAAIDLMTQKGQQQQTRPQITQNPPQPQQAQTQQNPKELLQFAPNQPFDLRSMPSPGCFNIVKRGNIPAIHFDYQLLAD